MAETVVIAPADLDRMVYVAIAEARDDAITDLLAGIARHVVERQPDVSAAELDAALVEVREAIAAHRPAREADLARNSALLLSRLLTRVVPALTTPIVRAAARDYTRAFFASHRAGAPLRRQVAPLDLQFDRFGQVQRFRREIWQRLYDQAKTRPDIAQAIDAGPIGGAVGVSTGQPAVAMLDAVPLEPLRGLVVDRVQGDGGILIDRTDIDVFLASGGATVTGLSQAYATNLMLLNAVQQDNEEGIGRPDPAPDPGGEEEESDFEKAIKKAEEKQKELDEILDKATKGVKGVFGVLSAAAKQFGEDDLATSIDEYAAILLMMIKATKDFADAAISVAKVIERLDDITFDQILLGAGIGFNVAIVAVAIGLSGLMGKSKSPTQVILEQLKEIRKQIVDLRDEMRVRFDRIEKRLNTMYLGLLDRLAEMDFDLGQIEGNLDELQVSLYDLHAELQRLTTNVHAFLEAANRRDLVEAINGSLGFRARTGEDLTLSDFRAAENEFFSWGNDHAKDELQAGTDARNFTDTALLAEITALPLATNVNYLRRLPAERLGLAPLSSVRLANPFDWIVAGEAYAQLHEESPDRPVSPARVESLMAVGEALGSSLSRIADLDLFAGLAERYLSSFTGLQAAIAAFEAEFRVDEDVRLRGIDLWGGAHQVPSRHPLDATLTELRRCDGRAFDVSHVAVPVPPSLSGFDYSALRPLMIASSLSGSRIGGVADGLAELTACVSARWDVQDVGTAPGPNVRVVYALRFSVNISYGGTLVFQHSYQPAETMQVLAPRTKFENGTFDPATDPRGEDPHKRLVGPQNLWAKLDTFPATHGVVNAPLVAATAALVEAKLVLLQRAFYSQVAGRFLRAGDPIQQTGQVLNGWKLVWQAFATAGLPLRIETNEILRALLFGSDAILGGSDADSADSLLDDVQDIYAFFSGREEPPPPANIATDIATLAQDRATELSALLEEIVKAIEETGEPEPPEVFAPTLLRLSLLLP